jgi:hypothetical protein
VDSETRREIVEAIAQADRCRRDDERREWQQQKQTQHKHSGELVYKTVINEPAPSAAALNDARWNEWAQSHIQILRQEIIGLLDAVCDEAGSISGQLARQIAELAEQVKELRARSLPRSVVGPPGPRGLPGRDGRDGIPYAEPAQRSGGEVLDLPRFIADKKGRSGVT